MASKKWECLEIHAQSSKQRDRLIFDMVRLMKQLKRETHLESYFFNRYSDPSKKIYFIKLGLVNSDKKAQSELNNLLEKHGVLEGIKPYDCEMWEVDGVPIDEIKCISCELFEKIKDRFGEKITVEQAFYLLHFLMNQLGYSYKEEYRLYKTLEENIRRRLEKKA